MTGKTLLRKAVPFCLFLLAGGMLAWLTRYELTVDFVQYHYYNGFAFWNDRLGADVAPAAIPTFYNPLLDAVMYKMHALPQGMYYFIQGLWFGALMYVAFKIAALFFDLTTTAGKVFAAIAVAVCATGSATWFQMGTATHEIELAVLELTAFYLLLRDKKRFFAAGLLLGLAAGFKLTASIYCVSTGLTLILFWKKLDKPLKNISLFALGGLAGFLIVDAFWMVKLWNLYGNPFFPFWNGIFKSPYFPEYNYVDDLHLYGKTVGDRVFAPFLMAFQYLFSTYQLTIDPRFAVAVIAGIAALIVCRKRVNSRVLFAGVYALVGFVVWEAVSFNARFLIPVEIVVGVLMPYAAFCLWKAYPELNAETAAFYGVGTVVLYGFLGAAAFGDGWGFANQINFFTQKFDLDENAVILIAEKSPLFAATRLAEQNPSVKLVQKLNGFDERKDWRMTDYGAMKAAADKTVENAPAVYTVFVQTHLAAHLIALNNKNCQILPLKDTYASTLLCKER